MSRALADHLHDYQRRLAAMGPAELRAETARHDALGYAAARASIEGRADGDFGASPGAALDVSPTPAEDTSPALAEEES